MFNKVIVFVLVLGMFVFVLTGCTGTTTNSDTAEAEQSSEALDEDVTEEVDNAEAETSDNAEVETSGGPIYFGMYTTLTGASATLGEVQERGARIAMEEINAQGGINGRLIELIVYDDGGTPEGAVKAVTRLIEKDGVSAIVGSFMSPNIIACAPQTEAAKMLHVGAGTGTTWTNAGYEYIFRGTINGSLPVSTFIGLMKEMGENTTALISVETEYGQSGRASILECLEDTDIELVAEVTYQSTDTDFTGHIVKVMIENPESVMVYGLINEMALLIKQLRQQGYTGCIYTCEGGSSTDIYDVAGSASDGLLFGAAYVVPTSPEGAISDVEKGFLEAYVAEYGEMPSSDLGYRGYDQVMLIVEALSNVEDIDDADLVRDAFLNITSFEGIAGNFDFSDGSGDGLTKTNGYMVFDQTINAFDKDIVAAWKATR